VLGHYGPAGVGALPRAGCVASPPFPSLEGRALLASLRCEHALTRRGLTSKDFDEATALFTSLQQTDPYRLDDVDVLSNILYVSEKRAELAALAQEYTRLDRVRPEVCCLIGESGGLQSCCAPLRSVIWRVRAGDRALPRGQAPDRLTPRLARHTGNYYSLRRDHEKAIVYFRRALKLDRGYLSAWTLMGHEYVEIKNTNAAIASYRRAVGAFSRLVLSEGAGDDTIVSSPAFYHECSQTRQRP